MSRLTAVQAEKINRMNGDAQAAQLGSSLKETQDSLKETQDSLTETQGSLTETRGSLKETRDYAPVIISYDITADATGALTAFTAPFAMEIVDVIVQARAAAENQNITPINAGQAGSGTDAMCTAIACAADGVVTHMAAGADDTKLLLAAGDIVKVNASADTVRGLVTFLAVRA